MSDSTRHGVSVVVIAKNAANTIKRCLDSVVNIASEVIVVTNDCTDGTEEIATLCGATVVRHGWEGFCQQKNFAIGLAKYKWVLSIDADEALSNDLARSIRSFVADNDQQYAGAEFARKTMFIKKWITHGDWYPDKKLRLFRNGHGKFVGNSVHEHVEVDGSKKFINGDLLHYSGESVISFISRNMEYARLSARDIVKTGKKVTFLSSIFRAAWRFFRCYVIKLGFLDGAEGFFIASTQGYLMLYKYFVIKNIAAGCFRDE